MTAHKFNPRHAKRLDDAIRERFLPTDKILQDIQPKTSDVWADIGAGTGYFTIPLAGLVDKVFGLDISADMLENLQQKLRAKDINNVKTILSLENKIPLEDDSMDAALLAMVAHELNDPAGYLKEIARILKPVGRLLVIEFLKVKTDIPFGPPLNERLNPEDVDGWAKAAGLAKGSTWRWSAAIEGWEYRKEDGRK